MLSGNQHVWIPYQELVTHRAGALEDFLFTVTLLLPSIQQLLSEHLPCSRHLLDMGKRQRTKQAEILSSSHLHSRRENK